MPSEISQPLRVKYHLIPGIHAVIPGMGEFIEAKSRIEVLG
jgi:hypothetical protein